MAVTTALALMVPGLSLTEDRAMEESGIVLHQQSTDQAKDSSAAAAKPEEAKSSKAAAKSESAAAADTSDEDSASSNASAATGPSKSSEAADSVGSASSGSAADAGDKASKSSASAASGKAAADSDDDDADDDEADDADEDDADEEADAKNPAQSLSAELKNQRGKVVLAVSVEAPEGALPEGATMKAKGVAAAKVKGAAQQAIQDAADATADGTATPAQEQAAKRAADKIDAIQAVDITFYNKRGKEIEPAQPVTVTFAAPKLAANAADGNNAPLVVHVDDQGEADVVGALSAKELKQRDLKLAKDELAFDADAFSVYALVYTVDFHYEANGKTYNFSIPGGGFVSLASLVDALGLAEGAEDAADVEDSVGPVLITTDDDDATVEQGEFVGPVLITTDDAAEATATAAVTPEDLLNVEASDAAREFVASIQSVEFSNPELAWVGQAESGATIGELKELNGLEVQPSADLTESQIQAIDATYIEPGDWALISLLPFKTKETLTVTMDNGDQWAVNVTDAQVSANVLTADGKTYKITVTYDDAQIPDGTQLVAKEIEPDTDDYLQLMGQTWLEINKDYFEVEKLRKNYNESMDFLPEVHLNNLDSGRYFDVKLIYKGEEIEPSAPVHVEIEYLEGLAIDDASTVGVAHFSDEGLEIIDEVETETEDSSVVCFSYDQNSFSDTGTFVSHETHGKGTTLAETLTNSFSGLGAMKASNDDSEEPAKPQADKTLVPNKAANGTEDGTYTLTLSVSGTSKKNSYSEVTKSNVVIVMDRSSSMVNNYTYDEYEGVYNSDLEYYGLVDGSYVALNYSNGHYTYSYNDPRWPYYVHTGNYTGTVYTRRTRLAAEQDALASLIKQLTDKNKPGQTITDEDGNTISLDDIIEIKLISFASGRTDKDKENGFKRNGITVDTRGTTFENTESGWGTTYSDGSTLKNAVIDNSVAKGTNWEEAMEYAREVADAKKAEQPDETVYVVFLTDGEPTDISGDNGNAQWYQDNEKCLKAAEPDAKGIVDPHTVDTSDGQQVATDHKFYGIFTYGETDIMKSYLRRLVNYAYGKGDVGTEGVSGGTGDYYFDADSTNALLNAFQHILSQVSNSVAYGKVSITDGLTTDAMTTTLVNGRAEGYKYTVTGALGELYSVAASGTTENPTVTFTVNGHDYPGVKKSATIDGATYDYWSCTVGQGDDAVEYKMTLADVDSQGQLTWDLTGVGALMDGYTYSVSFVVWPDQKAYDYVAALNNGLEGYDWIDDVSANPKYEDLTSTKGYEKGGVEQFPSIVKYPNGVYAVLTNTDQKVQYSIVDTRVENGETTTTYDGPYDFDLPTPEPMPLKATASSVAKIWDAKRDPKVLAQLLYNPDGTSKEYSIGFDILQDAATTPYTSVGLGWQAGEDGAPGQYVWKDKPEDLQHVDYEGNDVVIGTQWTADFSIATGLMLDEQRMEANNLDKTNPAYTKISFNDTDYWIQEAGHDYTIKEPDLSYAFDFEAPVYHPMLVNGVLKNVVLAKNGDTITGIEKMDDIVVAPDGTSALTITNTLRGYINLEKIVVDKNGTQLPDDQTKFEYTVTLENAEPVFKGDHIPWYGINSLFYHDADFNYYQADPGAAAGTIKLKDEAGDEYTATCAGTFNPDIIGPTEATYTDKNGTEHVIQLYGNRMQASDGNDTDGYKTVTATLKISQGETLNIANVPANTNYTIVESQTTGYEFVKATPGANTNATVEEATVTGTIVPNKENDITYKNRCDVVDITVQKLDEQGKGLAGAVFQLFKVVNGVETAVTDVGGIGEVKKTIDGREQTFQSAFETTGEVQTLSNLPDGIYCLREAYVPAGYISTYGYIQFEIADRTMLGDSVTTDTGDKTKLDFTPATTGQTATLALLQITNEPGTPLPNAGGPGTIAFAAAGLALIAAAAVQLLRPRRKLVIKGGNPFYDA